MSKTAQNHSRTLFDIRCVSEALPERAWKDFGVPNGVPKQVLEASSRPSKTSSFQLGRLGGLQNGFWEAFGPLGAGFWNILEVILEWKSSPTCVCHFSFALHVIVLQMGRIIYIRILSRHLSFRLGHPRPRGRLLGMPSQAVDYFVFPLPIPMCHASSY